MSIWPSNNRAANISEKRNNPLENPSVSLTSPAAWGWLSGGHGSDSGEVITPYTAMMVSTVAACVKVISESIASLPLTIYERINNGRQVAYGHSLYHLLADAPNDEMSAFTFWEWVTVGLCLHGNSYVQIQRDSQGAAIALWPLLANLTTPVRMLDGSIAYRTTDGQQQPRVLKSADVLHFLMGSHDGLVGLSPIQQARQAIGLARAAERYDSQLFKNSAVPAIAITIPGKLKPEDKTAARVDWERMQGESSQHRVAILDNGMSIEKLSISAEDSQFLQTRNYQRADIAAIFRIAPHLVGSTEKVSNSNLEQENLTLVTHTLRPWLSRLESEVRRKLLPTTIGKGAYVAEFDTAELTRGDTAAQSAALTAGIQGGWLCPNEARHALNLNPGPDCLNVYHVPVNYQNAERLLDPATAAPVPALVPTDAQRSLLADSKIAFLRMFQDGVSRVTNRPADKRSAALVSVFTPVLESLAELATQSARSSMGQDDLTHDTAKFISSHVTKMAERASKWTTENTDGIAADELTRAVKGLTFDLFRAAADQVARKELAS
jgi:HK97 family phage portal protein